MVKMMLLHLLYEKPHKNILVHCHIYMTRQKKNGNIMDKNNRREGVGFEILASIGKNDRTYDYNDGFWDSI